MSYRSEFINLTLVSNFESFLIFHKFLKITHKIVGSHQKWNFLLQKNFINFFYVVFYLRITTNFNILWSEKLFSSIRNFLIFILKLNFEVDNAEVCYRRWKFVLTNLMENYLVFLRIYWIIDGKLPMQKS